MADKISWIDPLGNEYPISEEHWQIDGMTGRFMPPVSFVEEEVPFQPGSQLREVRVKPREIDLPIYVEGTSEKELRSKLRHLLRLFNPLRGDGKFRITTTSGEQREIICRYSGGMEISEKKDSKIGNLQKAVLVFRAFDPFWYDTNTIVETFRLNESPGQFFPVPPVRLVSSTVFADITINNEGDVEAFPEWIISGPGEGIVLENLTTGETTELASSLGVGESITVNTKPYHKTVTRNDGRNLYVDLSEKSSLWALAEGVNNIRIQMSNATELSSVQLSYKNRYLGA